MRFFTLRLFVVLSLLFLVTSVDLVFAQGGGKNQRQMMVLSSRHKHAPQEVAATAKVAADSREAAPVRLAANGKIRLASAATHSRRGTSGKRWAALPLSKKLSAKSAIIIDGVTGETLYALAPDLPRQPASTIKVLTSLLAIEKMEKGDMVSPSRRAAAMPRSKIYLRPGKSYTANDLINAVLLASANDASVALAEKVGGSERNFAALMTAKARSLGARNTVCKTATGLTARGQHSTAHDLAVIFNKAMESDEFADRVGRSKVKTRFGKLLWNHNKALWQVHGAEGGKTGYTRAARQTYVGKFKRDQGEVVIALMGSETMWDDVKNLVEYGFARQQRRKDRKGAVALRPDVQDEAGKSVAAQLAAIRRLYGNESRVVPLDILADSKKVSKL